MSVNISLQHITHAEAQHVAAGYMHAAFDSVNVFSDGGYVSLHLPAGTAQSVADAINAAVKEAGE